MMMFLPQMRVSIVYPDGVQQMFDAFKDTSEFLRPSLPSPVRERYALAGPLFMLLTSTS